jgi:hypothetical protein
MLMHYYTEGRELLPKSYFCDKLENLSPEEYFNSGVLLWNFALHREKIPTQLLFSTVAREGFAYPDQDALNLLARGRVRADRLWNLGREEPASVAHDGLGKRVFVDVADVGEP